MSALTHSPGFFDFLKPIANIIAPIASVASFIPGIGAIAAPIAAISSAIAGSDGATPAAALVSAPAQSVVSTVPQVPLSQISTEDEGFEEEEEEF